jgi:uncharacterized membrane protein (DUF4010 family)
MFVRNIVILLIFAPAAVIGAAPSLAAMALVSVAFSLRGHQSNGEPAEPMRLSSPVSLPRVLKFAVIFLVISALGTIAQRYLGNPGFLLISVIGGLVSSASTTASAAALAASGRMSPITAGFATVLTSISSAAVNLPLVYQQTRQTSLIRRLTSRTVLIALLGLATLITEWFFMSSSRG